MAPIERIFHEVIMHAQRGEVLKSFLRVRYMGLSPANIISSSRWPFSTHIPLGCWADGLERSMTGV